MTPSVDDLHSTVVPCPPTHSRFANIAFGLAAIALLAMTLAWHLPMMLWDHLDLVPLLQAADRGEAWDRLFELHGGHWHGAAYLLLLVTTPLSGGQPWLDCLLSWALLLAFAALALRPARELAASRWSLLLLLLALYPGHLPNLQWGWQVAVVVCLLGVAATVMLLTRERIDGWHNALALVGAVLALGSFATAIALLPTALLLIAARVDQPLQRRAWFALPWLVLAAAVGWHYAQLGLHQASTSAGIASLLHYWLNFIGAGVSRFGTAAAPLLAAAAVLGSLPLLPRAWRDRHALPWLGLFAFAAFAAASVALGRAGDYGAEQAFSSRYVSFSSLFWLGFVGLLLADPRLRHRPRLLNGVLGTVLLFATFNALHLAKHAADVADVARATAEAIRASYPAVPEPVLRAIYFDQPEIARERLDELHRRGHAPF